MKTKVYVSQGNTLYEVQDIVLGPNSRVILMQKGNQITYNKVPPLSIVFSYDHVSSLTDKTVNYGDFFTCSFTPEDGYAISSARVIMDGVDISPSAYSGFKYIQPTLGVLLGGTQNGGENQDEPIDEEPIDEELVDEELGDEESDNEEQNDEITEHSENQDGNEYD